MKSKILTIDDDEQLLTLIRARLEAAGYDVVICVNSQEAVALARKEKPQLILLDVEMPKPNGFDCLQDFRKDPELKQTPIVMLTSRGETDFILKAQSLQVTDYLIKPFEPEDLISLLERYV